MFEISQSRPNIYQDDHGTSLDFSKLSHQLEIDSMTDSTILVYLYTPRNINTLTQELSQLIQLKEQYGFDIFLNLEDLDYQPLIERLEGLESLTENIDFAFVNNSKFTGHATSTFFIPNREGLKTSLKIVEKEYYKAKNIVGTHHDDNEKLITTEKYTAHHYNIGFGHGVGVYRIFFSLQLLGEDGLRRMWQEEAESLK
jgi:hypothetical protein